LLRKKPIQSRAKVTSDAILEAAEIIILNEGYDKATTNYIAEKAGASIGSLYQYFPHKDAIVSALIEQKISRIANGIRVVLRDSIELPLSQASRNAFEYLLNHFREHKILLYTISKQTPELVELTKNLSVERFTHSTNLALLEQHRDEIVVKDIEQALIVLEISVLSNMRRHILDNPTGMSDAEFIDSMVRLSTSFLTAELSFETAVGA
jgi:AcrR family transcriptional regulator